MSNRYEITEYGYGVCYFHDGSAFMFDSVDLPLISGHNWFHGNRGYPVAHIHGRTLVFHKVLFPEIDGEIDHINGNKLDNRRNNLRVVTHQQNAFNQKRKLTNTSGYIGVSRITGQDGYAAYIRYNGNKHHLGTFSDPKQAARTRDAVARMIFGEYAKLNFPKGGRPHAG